MTKKYIVLMTDDYDYVAAISFYSIEKAMQFIEDKKFFVRYDYDKTYSNVIECYVNDMAVALIIEDDESQHNLYMIAKQVYDETVFSDINKDVLFTRYVSFKGNTDIYVDDDMCLLRISSLAKKKYITNEYLMKNGYKLHSHGLRYRYARAMLIRHLTKNIKEPEVKNETICKKV
jgi:hypothetical protein